MFQFVQSVPESRVSVTLWSSCDFVNNCFNNSYNALSSVLFSLYFSDVTCLAGLGGMAAVSVLVIVLTLTLSHPVNRSVFDTLRRNSCAKTLNKLVRASATYAQFQLY